MAAATAAKETEEQRRLTSAVELPVSCDFDFDEWCGWSYDAGAYAWELRGGSTQTKNTGPSGDHTTATVLGM
jgi:hypothetical protein